MSDIQLIDVDSKMPNLALMKISSYWKGKGFNVVLDECSNPHKSYASKVFSYSKDTGLDESIVKGGFGYDEKLCLPDHIEHLCPDYDLYDGMDYSVGFITRGCPRKCKWCIVPEKEGMIRANADVVEFLRHDKLLLLDNNILAHSHGLGQLEKISKMNIKIDCNQGMDARLMNDRNAKLLASIKWWKPIRFSCDTVDSIDGVRKAVKLLRWYNAKPAQFFCYVLVGDVDEAMEVVKFLKGMYVSPFAQPYRDKIGTKPTFEQRSFARWVNIKQAFKSMSYSDFCDNYTDSEREVFVDKKSKRREIANA